MCETYDTSSMVEIEIGVLRTMCLDRRIEQRSELESEIAIWERRRNASKEMRHD